MLNILRNIWFYALALPISAYYVLHMATRSYFKDSEAWGERLGPPWHGWILKLAGVKIEYDLSALDPNGHYVFMANHTSNMDICAFYWLLGTKGWPIRFLAKQSLWNIPFFGRCMLGAGHIPIDRSNRRAGMKSVAAAVEKTKSGICPIIFPEGTRATDLSQLQPFKIGGMVLALKCGVPVVPLLIEGMGEVMPKGKLRIDSSRPVRIKALEPIDPTAYTLKEREKFKDDLHRLMDNEYRKMRGERA